MAERLLRFVKMFYGKSEMNLETQINGWIQKHQVNMLDLKVYGLGWKNDEYADYENHTAVLIYQAKKPIEDEDDE